MNYFYLWFIPTCLGFRSLRPIPPLWSLSQTKNTPFGPLESIPFSELYKRLDSNTVRDLYISNDMNDIYLINTNEVMLSEVVHSNPLLTEDVVEKAVQTQVKTVILDPPNDFLNSIGKTFGGLFDFIFVGVAVSILINIIRSFFRMDNMPSFGFKDTTAIDKTQVTTRLTDWVGSPEVFEECIELVDYIRNPSVYENAGAILPKGILLDGPPGTGKTLIAKAIAGETNATFFSVSGSEFVEMFVGLGASKVRKLFKQARENKPSIIFIDEIDAVGRKRGMSNVANSNDEREQTLNQILSEMDGFQSNQGVVVIAATNRRDVLDNALLRPGRFDRLIYVPLPDQSSREAILQLYLTNKTTNINTKDLAKQTGGFSGAQLKNLLNEAAIMAARTNQTYITNQNVEDALDKIIVGITKRVDSRSRDAKVRVAIHELGHAILAGMFNDIFELKKVSIKQTYSGIGGYTLFNEKPDIQESGLYTKEIIFKRIIIALGGQAAEKLVYGAEGVSVGASQDLKEANELARTMVEKYGMGFSLESFAVTGNERISDKTCETVDEIVNTIVNLCRIKAEMILSEQSIPGVILLKKLLAETVLEGDVVIQNLRLNNTKTFKVVK